MTRTVATALLALLLTAPAAAAEPAVRLTLDGRPVDRAGGVAFVHNGVVYADLIDLVKSFDGIMTYKAPSTWVTINGTTAVLTPRSRTMRVQRGSVMLPAPVIERNHELWVPLDVFVTRVAHAKVRHPSASSADIMANADPSS